MTRLMDTITRLIRMARLDASLDKRCLLAGTTVMDVPGYGEGRAPFHVLLDGSCTLELPDRPAGVVETPGSTFDTVRSREGEGVIDLFRGHYAFGRGAGSRLFQSLPDPLHVSFAEAGDANEIVRMLSAIMRREAQDDGPGAAVLSCLSSALLAMVLRKSNRPLTDTALWTAATRSGCGPRDRLDPGTLPPRIHRTPPGLVCLLGPPYGRMISPESVVRGQGPERFSAPCRAVGVCL
jgi:hypothetical protein